MFRVKRIYDPPQVSDGLRVLVDRVWPRGMSKERAAVDLWLKELAPSTELRQWFGHQPERWPEFKKRYRAELSHKAALLVELQRRAREGVVTLLFSAQDTDRNNAVALLELLRQRRGKAHGGAEPGARPELSG